MQSDAKIDSRINLKKIVAQSNIKTSFQQKLAMQPSYLAHRSRYLGSKN